jgi:hypothetical protein
VKWVHIICLILFISITHSTWLLVESECQTCHGPVEMYEQKQFAPLTMGWCINCHSD